MSSWCPSRCTGAARRRRKRSWFRLLLVEDWALTSRARKFMQVLFNGRDTLIEFDEPISLRALLGEEAGVAVRGRRVARALRALYAKHRAARIGPDLSHRRTIVNSVLRTRAVRAVVAQEMREKKLTRHQAMLQGEAVRGRDRRQLLARLHPLHGSGAVAAVESAVRRR